MEEARAIVFVPNTSLVEAAAVFEQKRATLEIAQEHDCALANILLVSVRLADRVPVQGHAEELALDEPFRQHGPNVLPDFAMRMVLRLLLLLHPAHDVWLTLFRGVVSA